MHSPSDPTPHACRTDLSSGTRVEMFGLPMPIGPLLTSAQPASKELYSIVRRALGHDLEAHGFGHAVTTDEAQAHSSEEEEDSDGANVQEHSDSLSFFATTSDRQAVSSARLGAHAAVGWMYFFVLLLTIASHYSKWLGARQVFPQELAINNHRIHLVVAFMLVGRSDAMGPRTGWRYWSRTVGAPLILLLAVYLVCCMLPMALAPEATFTRSDVRQVSWGQNLVTNGIKTYYAAWFIANLVIFKAVNGALYAVGLSRGQVAALALLSTLTPRSWLRPAAPIWNLGYLVDATYASGVCSLQSFLDLRMFLSFLCPGLGFQARAIVVIDVRWFFYCAGPFVLSGDALRPSILSNARLPLAGRALLTAWCLFSVYVTCRESLVAQSFAPGTAAAKAACLRSTPQIPSDGEQSLTLSCCEQLDRDFVAHSRSITQLLVAYHPHVLFVALIVSAAVGRTVFGALRPTERKAVVLERPAAWLTWAAAVAVVAMPYSQSFGFKMGWVEGEWPAQGVAKGVIKQMGHWEWIRWLATSASSADLIEVVVRRLAWQTFQIISVVCWAHVVPRTPGWVSDAASRPAGCYLLHHFFERGPIIAALAQLMNLAEATWPVVLPTALYMTTCASVELLLMVGLPYTMGQLFTLGKRLYRALDGLDGQLLHGPARTSGAKKIDANERRWQCLGGWRRRPPLRAAMVAVASATLFLRFTVLVPLPGILGYSAVASTLKQAASRHSAEDLKTLHHHKTCDWLRTGAKPTTLGQSTKPVEPGHHNHQYFPSASTQVPASRTHPPQQGTAVRLHNSTKKT